MFPLELIDFICEKINRKILLKITTIGSLDNLLFSLNKKHNDLSDLIRDNDLYGAKYYFTEKIDWQTQLGKDSSLAFACQFDSFDVIKYLVEIGADVRYINDTSLLFACKWGTLETVKFLIKNGADIAAQDNSPLEYACTKGNLDIVKCLIENGADLTRKYYWPLKTAVIEGHLNIIKYAVEIGIKFPAEVIIKYAKINDNNEIIEYLEQFIKI